MHSCMRTTLSIPDHLLREAKRRTAERGCTLSEVVSQALIEAFASEEGAEGESEQRPLKTFAGTGVLPGVDLGDSADLLRIMDQGGA